MDGRSQVVYSSLWETHDGRLSWRWCWLHKVTCLLGNPFPDFFSFPGNSGIYKFIPGIPGCPGMTFTAVLLAQWCYEKLSVSLQRPMWCCCLNADTPCIYSLLELCTVMQCIKIHRQLLAMHHTSILPSAEQSCVKEKPRDSTAAVLLTILTCCWQKWCSDVSLWSAFFSWLLSVCRPSVCNGCTVAKA